MNLDFDWINLHLKIIGYKNFKMYSRDSQPDEEDNSQESYPDVTPASALDLQLSQDGMFSLEFFLQSSIKKILWSKQEVVLSGTTLIGSCRIK